MRKVAVRRIKHSFAAIGSFYRIATFSPPGGTVRSEVRGQRSEVRSKVKGQR
jgi:hypothetical protein